MQKNIAIVLAGGSGNRMNQEAPKAFIKVHQKFLIEYSIIQFQKNELIHEIFLVVPIDFQKISEESIKANYSKISKVLPGGSSRYKSSCIGVNAVGQAEAKILIHDAARPFLTQRMIQESIHALDQFDAVNVLAPVSDTLVQLKEQNYSHSIDRSTIRKAQTPQSFKYSSIKKAQELANDSLAEEITDDFALVVKYQTGSHNWIEGSQLNFKITYPEDLEFAKKLLKDEN